MRLILAALCFVMLFASCQKAKVEGDYKVINHTNKSGAKPQVGEYAYCHIYQRAGTEVLGSTRQSGDIARIKLPELSKDGKKVEPDIAGLRMMSVGDSLTVFISVDTLKKPEKYKELKFIEVDLVLLDIKTEAAYKADMEKAEADFKAKNAVLAEKNVAYLTENKVKPGVITTASGLQYEVMKAGTGAKPNKTDVVKVHYLGTLIDGSKFDSSYDRNEPIEFPLDGVIPGWTEGVQLMKVGSKYKFHIPSALGYGDQGAPGGKIPPGSTLVFEVELLGTKPAPKAPKMQMPEGK